MDCLLIFDHLNDLIYTKFSNNFEMYIKDFAFAEGLLAEDSKSALNNNVFIQIFSPIVTSHRIMQYHFGNSYTSIQFHEDLKIDFSEYMGYLFMAITDGSIDNLVQMSVTFAQYLCGPDIYQLTCDSKSDLLTTLIEQWKVSRNENQAVLVEAVEQLVVNSDISSACLHSLKKSIVQLSIHPECSRVHAMLLVDDKLLSLYSSIHAKELSSTDILLTTILTHCRKLEDTDTIQSFQILLHGSEVESKCLPHIAHIVSLFEKVILVFLVQLGHTVLSAALYEVFYHLHALQLIQIQREKETIEVAYENVEIAYKKLNDNLKKAKNAKLEVAHKQLVKQWDLIKTKYKEYFKTSSADALLRTESLARTLLKTLKELFALTIKAESVLASSSQHVTKVIPIMRASLVTFIDFFKVKGIKNFTLGSYLQDFPGLVHFLYIDRNTHRVTTPSLDMSADDAEFIKEKVWFMVSFGRKHLQQGHHAIIWKDKIFAYSYFLWFEDNSGGPLKPTAAPYVKSQKPGILKEDYFTKIKKLYFPKLSQSKVKCYELFCLHLGLMTPTGILEQTRRLAATIWNIRGFPSAIDLF